MSPEHIELTRQLYEAVNRRDLAALHAMGERYPDWEWRNAPNMPESALRGRDGGLKYMEELFQAFDRGCTRRSRTRSTSDQGRSSSWGV